MLATNARPGMRVPARLYSTGLLSRLRFHTFLLLMAVLFSPDITAKEALSYFKSISVTVNEQDGGPVFGATVRITGKTGGTQTNESGKFVINAEEGVVIEVSAVGFVTGKITVGAETAYRLVLVKDVSEMNQVVVVGYGTQKKVNLTGSVAHIGGVELTKRPATNVQN